MPLVTQVLEVSAEGRAVIPVVVDRHVLSKRRWRVTAADGLDLAVDLEQPCAHGAVLWETTEALYTVEQTPEPVLELPIPTEPAEAAFLGWFLGNQHLPVEITEESLRLAATPHLAARLEREGIAFEHAEAVFAPPAHSVGHAHGHGHSHGHEVGAAWSFSPLQVEAHSGG